MADLTAVQRPISDLPVATKISIPGSPDWVGVGPDAVWISNARTDSVARIDPVTNRVTTTVPVGRRPCSGLAVGLDAVWVPSCQDNRVDRVNPRSNQVEAHIPTPIGDSEGGIASGEGAIWLVTDRRGTLTRIDGALNRINGHAQLASGSFVPVVGAGAVWVSSTEHNLISRVHPKELNVTSEIPVGPAPLIRTFGYLIRVTGRFRASTWPPIR